MTDIATNEEIERIEADTCSERTPAELRRLIGRIRAERAAGSAALNGWRLSNALMLRAQHDAAVGDERWAKEQARIARERDDLKARVQSLLESNNEYLQRARNAEHQVSVSISAQRTFERLAYDHEKRAEKAEAERDRLAARAILDLPGMVPGYGYERSDIVKAERAKHAETEQAMHDALVALTAERDRLRAALEDIAGRLHVDGGHDLWARAQGEPCTCVLHVAARALLGEVKP